VKRTVNDVLRKTFFNAQEEKKTRQPLQGHCANGDDIRNRNLREVLRLRKAESLDED
jgi:hypothetical protein